MITLCAPKFDAEDRARVEEVLSSGMLVQSKMVGEFEGHLSGFLGREAIACSNGTAALHIALQALGIGSGDEVIVPGFTWPSAAHTVVNVGAQPVFVDIDPGTLNLDPERVEALITPRTRALLPIHQFGIPAPMNDVMAIAERHGLPVIEDAACAIGTTCEDGRLAGTIGAMGCFSFHPRKVATTGEGGAVVTSDEQLAYRIRVHRNHGQDPTKGLERFVACGLNYRMPEMCAAIGIGQLERLEAILAHRRLLGRRYIDGLSSVDGVRVPAGVQLDGNNFQSFVVDVDPADRDRIMSDLREKGVQTTIGTYAVPGQPAWSELSTNHCPEAERAMQRLITLPLHEGLTEDDIDTVARALDSVLGGRGGGR